MDRSGDRRGLARRKACDFCLQKKFRCDARKPDCDNCHLQGVECLWTACTRPTRSERRRYRRAIADEGPSQSLEDHQAIQDEVSHEGDISDQDDRQSLNGYWSELDADVLDDMSPDLCERVMKYVLPPRSFAQPLIDGYFNGLNQSMPIFKRDPFMKMVDKWYTDLDSRDTLPWACISVVLALSLRHIPERTYADESEMIKEWTKNAASVVDELHSDNFTRLQVLLGLVVLSLVSTDIETTRLMIAKAVSFLYQRKMERRNFRPSLQRDGDDSESARLFWITYILDRHTSMTARQPYLLQDNDIGITLEDMISDYRAGYIFPGGVQPSFDILKSRVQLGIIQGRLYDLLYSVRAKRESPENKEASRVLIDTMLDQWYNSLPASVKTNNFSAMEAAVKQHCHLLHMVYYQTLFAVHDAALHNRHWIRRLHGFSEKWRVDKQKAKKAYDDTPLLLSNWPKLLEVARAQVDMLSSMDTPGSVWLPHRPYRGLRLTGVYATEGVLAVLAANNIAAYERATHDHLHEDEDRVQKAWSNIKSLNCEYTGGRHGQYYHQEINMDSEQLVREAGWCYDKYFNKRQRPNYWVDKMNANPASFGIY